MSNNLSSKDFLVGAAIGGVLGTVTALMVAPKSGREIRDQICDRYCDISTKATDLADTISKKGKGFVNQFNEADDISSKTKALIQSLTDIISPGKKEENHMAKDLLYGSLAGIAIGATAGLLLAPKSGVELREDLADAYEDISDRTEEIVEKVSKRGKAMAKNVGKKSNNFLNAANELVDQVTGTVKNFEEDYVEKGKDTVKEILDWVSLGMRVVQHLKKRG